MGYTASQVWSGTDPRLVRTTPASYGPGFCWCDNLVFAYAVDAMRVDLDTPVHALGLGAIGNVTGGYSISMYLYAGDTLLGTASAGGVAGWQGNTGVTFLGAHSATAFDRVEITGPGYGFAMNHLAVGEVSPVPEPRPALLLALGLAGLSLRRRRDPT